MAHKYESDMTKREKRRMEREKLRSMSPRQKLEYLWMYYKVWLVVAVVLAGCIYTGAKMYRGMQENVIVSAAIIGNGVSDTKELEEGFKVYVGADGRHDTVRVNQNVTVDEGGPTAETLLTTLIGAEAVDVLLCPRDVYEEYSAQNGFTELSSGFGKLGDEARLTQKKDGIILHNNSALKEMTGIVYDEIYVAVLVNSPRTDCAKQFAQYLAEEAVRD